MRLPSEASIGRYLHQWSKFRDLADLSWGGRLEDLGSAARDAGDPAGVDPAPPVDLDGVPRPQGPRVDLGAYEWRGVWLYLPLVTKK